MITMLFALLPIAWLALLAVVVCVCRVASEADAGNAAVAALAGGPPPRRVILRPAPLVRDHSGRSRARLNRARAGRRGFDAHARR